MFTEIGPVEIEVPRDTNSSFVPQIVKKRQRRLSGIDEIVLSLTAKGLTTGEIAAHFDDVYGATVSKDTISRITDKVIEEMTEWCNRPLESRCIRWCSSTRSSSRCDGQVTNRPIYVAIGVTCAGERDILGLWAGDGGEGAKFWLAVLTEINPLTYAVEPMRHVVFEHLAMPPAVLHQLDPGITWGAWVVPIWLDVLIVALLGSLMLAIAAIQFRRTD